MHRCSVGHQELRSFSGLATVRKKHDGMMPCKDNEGTAGNPRQSWNHNRCRGYGQIIRCNVYLQCGLGLTDDNIECLKSVVAATDKCRRCFIASGDWDITGGELQQSGILEGLGLETVVPRTPTSRARRAEDPPSISSSSSRDSER